MKRGVFLLISFALAACGGTVESGSERGYGDAGDARGECVPLPCPYPGWDPETCACKEAPLLDAGAEAGLEAAADAPQGALIISILSVDMGLNCMPEVPDDPMAGSFTVRYDNSQGVAPASATLTGAQWSLPVVWSFEVLPAETGMIPAGEVIQVVHEKVPDSAQGSGNPCAVCNGVGQLRVTWKLPDGQTVTESKTGMPQCAW